MSTDARRTEALHQYVVPMANETDTATAVEMHVPLH